MATFAIVLGKRPLRRSTPQKARADATSPADRGEQDALHEELPDEPAAAGAEGRADGDLASAVGGAREQEVADVGGGDEEHESHRAEQDQERGLDVARVARGDGGGGRAPPALVLRIGAGKGGGDPRHRRRGLRDRHARLEPADHPDEPRPGVGGGRAFEHEGGPHLGASGMDEAGRHHAHDGVALVVEGDRAPDHAGIGAEFPTPQRIGEDHDVVVARSRVFGSERAPQARGHPEDLEEVSREPVSDDRLRLAGPGEAAGPVARGAQVREHAAAVAVGGVGHGRHRSARDAALGAVLPDPDEPVRVGEGQRPQEHGVHDAEDRHVGADGDGEGGDGYGRRTRDGGAAPAPRA